MTAVRRALFALLVWTACRSSTPPYGARAPSWGMPEALPPLQAHEQVLVDRTRALLTSRSFQAPVMDARLARASVALNHRREENRTREACEVSPLVLEGALDWAGVYERPVCQRCYWTRKTPVPVPDEITQSLSECLAGPGQTSIGIASLLSDDRTFVSVIGVRKQVTLDPAPRVVPRGSLARLSGSAEQGALPATVILSWPDQPSKASALDVDGNGRFQIDVGAVGTWVLVTVVNASGEIARLRLAAPPDEPSGAFEHVADDDTALGARMSAVRDRLQALRTRRKLAPFQELTSLMAPAQDEANDAQMLQKWVLEPMNEARFSVVSSVVPNIRVTKWIGESVDDLMQQIERDGVVLFALTRSAPTKLGVGLASPPDGTGAKRLTLVVVAGVDDASVWDR